MDNSEENSLVIDQIIDNFGEDELLDEDTEEEKSEYHSLVMCDDEDEENSIEEEESLIIETDPDPEALAELDIKSQSKYGKLWQFIRDLLRNERFNPSIIKWENIEEGEFRIVDSILLAKLWATVKENKKMNYEKLSRAMRYYYKNKIFSIVEGKRLVYKFGSKATGWKPRSSSGLDILETGDGTNNLEIKNNKNSIWCGPSFRCYKCLRVLSNANTFKEHKQSCTTIIDLKNLIQKKKLKVQEDNFNSKTKKQKTSKDVLSYESNENGFESTSTNETSIFNEREQEALETLMNLGSRETLVSATVSEFTSAGHLSSMTTSEMRNVVANDTLTTSVVNEADINLYTTVSADKGQLRKVGAEKCKSQTILLQRRSNNFEANNSAYRATFDDDSDDEIEIVDIIKNDNEDLHRPKNDQRKIEDVVETVINNQAQIQTKIIEALPSSSKIVINNKFINVITPSSSGGSSKPIERMTTSSETSIKINPKYLNLLSNKTGSDSGSRTPPLQEAESRRLDIPKSTIRLNPKYTNIIAGSNPKDCGNIVNSEDDIHKNLLPQGQPSLMRTISVNPKYLSRTSEAPTLTTLLKTTNDPSLSLTSSASSTITQANANRGTTPTLFPRKDLLVSSPQTLKRRSSDNTFEKYSTASRDLGEPLPNLWKFLRALLHNPNFNPKLIAWKEIERGEFRMNNLQEFYKIWETMKRSDISYDLWVKTIKLYDEKKYLHSVEGFRCCYKFGIMASDWKPFPHEIITNGGKGCFPSQATWNNSRFYKDFLPSKTSALPISPPVPSAVGGNVTTLFTLRPLDNSASSFSEMEVMSDNTSIIKPNSSPSKVLLSPPSSIISASHDKAVLSGLEEKKKDIQEKYLGDLVINCQIKFPKLKTDKVILRLDDGPFLELDRNIFSSVEHQLRNISTNPAPQPSIKTTIVHKDKSFNGTPSKKRKILRKHKPVKTGQGILSNRLTLPVLPGTKKYPVILPKPNSERNMLMREDISSLQVERQSSSSPLYTTMQNTEQDQEKAKPQTCTFQGKLLIELDFFTAKKAVICYEICYEIFNTI